MAGSKHCSTILRSKLPLEEATFIEDEIKFYLKSTIGRPTDQIPAIKEELSMITKEMKVITTFPKSKAGTMAPQDRSRLKDLKQKSKVLINRAKVEKVRLAKHQKIYNKLFNHVTNVLVDTQFLVDYTQILDAVNTTTHVFLQRAVPNLNNENIHQIKSIEKMIDRFVAIKPNTKKLGWFANYHQDIWRMISKREHTGVGINLLNKITGLKDSIFDEAAPFIDDYTDFEGTYINLIEAVMSRHSNDLSALVFRERDSKGSDRHGESIVFKSFEQMSPEEQRRLLKQDYIALKNDLADGRVRYMKPTLYQDLTPEEKSFVASVMKKDFASTEYGETFRGLSHYEMVTTDPNNSEIENVWVMLKRNEDGSESDVQHEYYPAVLVRKGSINPNGELQFMMTLGDQGEHLWDNTGIKEGFYEAGKYNQFNYTIKQSSQRVGEYSNFTIMDKQPHHAIAGINAPQPTEDTGQMNIWQSLSAKRDLNSRFFDYLEKNFTEVNDSLNEASTAAQATILTDLDDKSTIEMIELIDGSGQMSANILETKSGFLVGWDTFIQKVKQNFDPRVYKDLVYDESLDEAIDQVDNDINKRKAIIDSLNEVLDAYNEGISTGDQIVSGDEFAMALDEIGKHKKTISRWDSQRTNLIRMRNLSLLTPTPENIKKMKLLHRIVHAKHRKTFMNPMDRERDEGVFGDYIRKTITAIQYNKLKVEMLKAIAVIKNPELKRWLINQSKVAMGDMSHEAGFMGVDLSYGKLADIGNKAYKITNSTRRTSPESIAKRVATHNNWISGNLLNFISTLGNYTQLESVIETWGLEHFMRAIKARKLPEIQEALKFSGVLDLINAYADFMSGGSTEDINWATPIKSRAAMAGLWASKVKFINNSTTFDGWLRKLLPHKDRDSLTALKRQRKLMYEQFEILRGARRKKDGTAVLAARELRILKNRINSMNKNMTKSQVNQAASWMLTWLLDEKFQSFTFSGAELLMREITATEGMMLSQDFQELDNEKPGNIYKQEPALRWARSHTYNTMFGMSREYFPQMFTGLGAWSGQFKTYQFQEMIREYKIMEDFFGTTGGGIFNVPGWGARLLKASGQKGKRTIGGMLGKGSRTYSEILRSKDPKFDLSAERALNFFFWRGGASFLTTALWWSPGLMAINTALKAVGKRSVIGNIGVRPVSSVIISNLIKAIYLITAGWNFSGDKPEEQMKNDLIMLFAPVAFNVIFGLYEGNWAKTRPYVPFTNTIEAGYEVGKAVAD